MKKFISILLISLMIMTLGGCQKNISVEFNGVDINGRDAASFGRDIANAAADNLFEAFTRRGIDAIRTLRQ